MQKSALKKFIQYTILTIIAFFIYRYFQNNREELKQIIHIKPKYILFMGVSYALILLALSYKMFLILRSYGLKDISLIDWFKIYLTSRILNTHITQSGNIYRTVKLKKDYQFPYTESIGVLTLFTWLELLFILVTSLVFLNILDREYLHNNPLILWFHLVTISSIALAPFMARFIFSQIKINNKTLQWVNHKLSEVAQNFTESLKDKVLLIQFTLISMISFVLIIATVYTSFLSIGIKLPITSVILFTVLNQLSGLFIITPGNLGVTEIFFGYLSKLLGNSMGQGILVSAILRVILYGVTILLTLCFAKSFLAESKTMKEHL